MKDSPTHLVVRIPLTGDPLPQIIERHEAVASQMKSVWFGVSGQLPSAERLQTLTKQIDAATPTFLHVVQRSKGTLQVFRSPLLQFEVDAPVNLELVPPYYTTRPNFKPILWLRVGRFKEVPFSTLDQLHVQTTGNCVSNAILKGMSSLLIVAEGAGQRMAERPRLIWK